MRVGIWIGGAWGEENRGETRDVRELEPGARAGLLDDGLRLLARGVRRRLVDQPQPLSVLRPDAIGTSPPAGGVEDLVGALDVELPARVARVEAGRGVQEVRRGPPAAALDPLLD